jgi:uncharacterized protein YdhG (YjbR/CyaY superfamily)
MGPTKSSKSTKRTPVKAKRLPKSVDEYAAGVPDAAGPMFITLRETVRSAVPPTAKEIISYGIPAFADDGIIVWFAAFSNHCSLFPTKAVIQAFQEELKDFSQSKGTIHFPLDKPLPKALIRKLVKTRVKQRAG